MEDQLIELQIVEKVDIESLTERERSIYHAGIKNGVESMTGLLIGAIILVATYCVILIGIHNHFKHGGFWSDDF